jgi:hypothetical protein
MGIAVEREEAIECQRTMRQRVIQVLSRRVTVELDGDATLCRRGKYGVPLRDDAGARPRDATPRVARMRTAGGAMAASIRSVIRSGRTPIEKWLRATRPR